MSGGGGVPAAARTDGLTGSDLPVAALYLLDRTDSHWDAATTASRDEENGNRMMAVNNYGYNGADMDRWRNNFEGTALASAARTAATNSPEIKNHNGRGLVIYVNVTLDPASAAITPSLRTGDPVSGTYDVIWTAAAAISATGLYSYQLGPGLLATAGGSYTDTENILLPRSLQISMGVADGDSMTYSVAYCLTV